jgi:hypothetical protein
MAPNADLCQREIERLRSKGWSSVFAGLPALPCRLLPCGSVERKSEQKRPRRTVNASALFPEDTWVDADGKKVESLNSAIKRPVDAPSSVDVNPAGAASVQTSTWASGVLVPKRAGLDTSPLSWEAWRATCSAEGLNALTAPNRPVHLRAFTDKWPKEIKPTIAAKLRDITILRHAGIIFGEEVAGMSTDFADYFSQLSLAPSTLWMHIVHWAGLEGVPESALGAFVLDERLGFGASSSSNIGQRLSHSLNGVFRSIFDSQKQLYSLQRCSQSEGNTWILRRLWQR